LLTVSNGGENDFSRITPLIIVFRYAANPVVDLQTIWRKSKVPQQIRRRIRETKQEISTGQTTRNRFRGQELTKDWETRLGN
jgi:hypothetical protein